jgi:hypothetical protein
MFKNFICYLRHDYIPASVQTSVQKWLERGIIFVCKRCGEVCKDWPPEIGKRRKSLRSFFKVIIK